MHGHTRNHYIICTGVHNKFTASTCTKACDTYYHVLQADTGCIYQRSRASGARELVYDHMVYYFIKRAVCEANHGWQGDQAD